MTRAVELMLRLGDALIAESDGPAATALVDKLRGLAPEDERVRDLVARVAKLAEKKAAPAAEVEHIEGVPSYPPEALNRGFNMADELAFAWALLEANEMSQEDYASVVQDLTEMSAGNVPATVSLLHVLESRQFKSIGRIMAYAAQRYRAPVISLDSFEFTEEVCKVLPLPWIVQRGAVVFDILDRDVLAVLMNPSNKQTRTDVELMTGRKVHFYMSLPSEFDSAVKRMKDALETAQIVKDNKERK
jgi:hypothetical protein